MPTLLVSHPQGLNHLVPSGHPERPERLLAIEKALFQPRFNNLIRKKAIETDLEIVELVHCKNYLKILRDARPAEGIGNIDADTFISCASFDAIASGVGAGLVALDAVILGEVDNAFCAIRPPGHHAEIDKPMGFCLINNIAIVAREAIRKYGADRVAIIDFDVHHGNGTEDIFKQDKNVFYASSHQMDIYPGTGKMEEEGVGNIVNCPLAAGSNGVAMREAYESRIFPALENFSPDIILISAGFDADKRDPLAGLNWQSEDFAWITGKLMDIADKYCNNRIISMLEGGYDLNALADGSIKHVNMLNSGISE